MLTEFQFNGKIILLKGNANVKYSIIELKNISNIKGKGKWFSWNIYPNNWNCLCWKISKIIR